MAAHVFTQTTESFPYSPLDNSASGFTPASPHTSGTGGVTNASHGQFDPNLVQLLAQEMMKLMKGNQVEPSPDSQQSFAHFAGITSVTSTSYAPHSSSCSAMQHNYCGSWIIDTGASDHMTSDLTQLFNLQPLPQPILITLPDGSLKTVATYGQIHLFPHKTIHTVLYVPDFEFNLLSVSKLLTAHKLFVIFFSDHCYIQDLSTKQILAVAPSVDGLYKLSPVGTSTSSATNVLPASFGSASFSLNPSPCSVPSLAIIHARLGHTLASKMQHIPGCNNVPSVFPCDVCVLAKMHRLPFNKSSFLSTQPLHLIHLDLWGPYRVANICGARYFLTIVDDFTRNTWTQLLQNKSQVKTAVVHFYNMIATQFGVHIKMVRSDNGTEFINDFCHDLFSSKGILHQKSIVRTPQ